MKRRSLLAVAASIAASRAALAQPDRRLRIGFLHPGQSQLVMTRVVAFREGLLGGTLREPDVEIVVQLANDRIDRLPAMAQELVDRGVRAICAVSPPAVKAAYAATRSIPILAMDLESDPVTNGWAASLARPGGNVSGVFLDLPGFNAKSLQLLREIVPGLAKASVFWHPASGRLQLDAVRNAATALGIQQEVVEVSAPADFEPAFQAAVAGGCRGVLMLSSPLFGGNPQLLADLAIKHRLPAINIYPEFAQKGGLLGYGPDLQSLFAQAGTMVRKAIQAGTASDLPIERPTRFKLVANLATARLLGTSIPPSVLAGADEVIE